MARRVELEFLPDSLELLAGCEVVFLARDNGVAMGLAPGIAQSGAKVIDLSADFRFRNPAEYESWYKIEHKSAAMTMAAVYGLPELHKDEIKEAQIIGNPGCYTTASILALAPLVKYRLIDPDSIVIDGKSGISGAGRSKFGLDYHFSEANESVSAYKVAGTHRHTGEIEQELSILAGRPVRVSFTPHLIPMTRGILASCYARLSEGLDANHARELYRTYYTDAPFVHISVGLPATKHVSGTNMCHIGLAVDSRTNRITVISAIDNLGKGMAGQAIQNMNLMCGFEETAGLEAAGLWP
jgi:N-acetyl-gamma-glutamyl-phosphate reductase